MQCTVEIEADADVRAVVMQGGRTHVRSILKTAVPGRGGASTSLVMIGGLLSSTLLALVVIPVIDNLVVEPCRGGAGRGDLLTPPRSPPR